VRYLTNKKIGIIGIGNMGGAILNGLISSGAARKSDVIGFDSDAAKRASAKKRFGVPISKSISEVTAHCDIIILAVKPQSIDEVLKEIRSCGKDRLYISIAAGIKTYHIEKELDLGHRPRVIRVMPNTPALVGEGISALCGGRYAAARDIKTANEIFLSVGETVEAKEKYFDLITAVSGSGPAYFFYLKEALVGAAVRQGMDKTTAKKLVSKTGLGAARLLMESGDEPEILRQRVTSKGGTTERAIEVFERAGMRKIIERAVIAAMKRSKELSEG